jgi:stearoyl-CoA desaturase (delta-9 desaturase)
MLNVSWWQALLIGLFFCHITIISVTIYLHRHLAHCSLSLHPFLSHFFRFWLWLTTGTISREWAAIHRAHHAYCETDQDPHSPNVLGIYTVLFKGYELYKKATKNNEILKKYGQGMPNDWLERHLYSKYSHAGILCMLFIDFILLKEHGLWIWALQMIWIPFWAAGFINGVGHFKGYRNFDSPDFSKNILPLALFVGGEELHNNHHAFPYSAKLSFYWYEFDIGWMYISVFQWLKLASVKNIYPKINYKKQQLFDSFEIEHLKIILKNKYVIASDFSKIFHKTCKQEIDRILGHNPKQAKEIQRLLNQWLSSVAAQNISHDLEKYILGSSVLQKIVESKITLNQIWDRKSFNHIEDRLKALEDWCHHVESIGIDAMNCFCLTLKKISIH